MVAEKGNLQQYLYHLHDGPEQEERDQKIAAKEEGEALAWRDSGSAPMLLGYLVEKDVSSDLRFPTFSLLDGRHGSRSTNTGLPLVFENPIPVLNQLSFSLDCDDRVDLLPKQSNSTLTIVSFESTTSLVLAIV